MRNLKRSIKRWRNSRGFGVHSPFGFFLVNNVLRLGKDYAYYAEKDIIRAGNRDNATNKAIQHAIKLHRLAAVLHPDIIFYSGRISNLIQLALNSTGYKIKKNPSADMELSAGERHMFIIEDGEYGEANLAKILSEPDNSLIVYSENSEDTAKKIMGILCSGIVIEGNNCVMVLSRLQTQPNMYQMDF